MRYLLDTNVVSALRVRGRNRPVEVWAASVPVGDQFVSAFTVAEIERGVVAKERSDAEQGVVLRRWFDENVLPTFADRVLPFDLSAARIGGLSGSRARTVRRGPHRRRRRVCRDGRRDAEHQTLRPPRRPLPQSVGYDRVRLTHPQSLGSRRRPTTDRSPTSSSPGQVSLSLGGSVYDPTDAVGRLLRNVLALVARVRARTDPA